LRIGYSEPHYNLRERHSTGPLSCPAAPIENVEVKDFRQLKVWEKAHHLTVELYQVTANFPRAETYGLISQIRRASASICANLAEGCGREGDAELGRFCGIARGSASELEYHRTVLRNRPLVETADYDTLAQETTEIKRMLTALMQKLIAESLRAAHCGAGCQPARGWQPRSFGIGA